MPVLIKRRGPRGPEGNKRLGFYSRMNVRKVILLVLGMLVGLTHGFLLRAHLRRLRVPTNDSGIGGMIVTIWQQLGLVRALTQTLFISRTPETVVRRQHTHTHTHTQSVDKLTNPTHAKLQLSLSLSLPPSVTKSHYSTSRLSWSVKEKRTRTTWSSYMQLSQDLL